MPKVSADHRLARKRQVSAAAVRLFARKGFDGTSMADIIEASGLSAGAIYGHYKSKDELILFAISDLFETRVKHVEIALALDPMPAPGEVIRLLLEGIATEIGDLGILLLVWGQASLEPQMRGIADLIIERFLDLFNKYLRSWYSSALNMPVAQAEENAGVFAALYVGILQGYVVQSSAHAGFDRDAYLAAASAIRPEGL